jgi:hypothetical protein
MMAVGNGIGNTSPVDLITTTILCFGKQVLISGVAIANTWLVADKARPVRRYFRLTGDRSLQQYGLSFASNVWSEFRGALYPSAR